MPSSSAAVLARRRALDGLGVDVDRDARAAQLVGDGDRQVGRHDRLLDPPALHRAQHDLELRLVALDAVGEQLVEAELVEQDQLGVGGRLGDPGGLERAGEDRGLAVAVADREQPGR